MKTIITYDDIVTMNLCYHPDDIKIPKDYSATIPEFIKKYRDKVKEQRDIIWILCRDDYMTDKEILLYRVWCASQVQHLMTDARSIYALDDMCSECLAIVADNERAELDDRETERSLSAANLNYIKGMAYENL